MEAAMLEKLPEVLGHALREQRAGLDKLAFEQIGLRGGMGAIDVRSLAFVDHAPIPASYTADGAGSSPPLQWTGVPAEDIRKLARDYAGARPAAIRVNYGVQRSENGGAAMRAIAMLPVVTGSFQHAGGGICLSTSGAYGLDEAALTRPDLMQAALGRPARVLNMSELGRVLLDAAVAVRLVGAVSNTVAASVVALAGPA